MANEFQNPEINVKKFRAIITTVLVVIVGLIFIFKISVTIESGHAGVLYKKFSGGTDMSQTYPEGFHIIAPWNNMLIYEVRQQQLMEKMAVLSSNGLEISVDVSAWYQPQYEKLALLHKKKGRDYVVRVIIPALRSATRSVIGRYTPEEIYSTKRDAIQTEINAETKVILQNQYITLKEILVRDITLPATIKQAIENKLKQEQASLEYEFKISKARKEAERQKIDAEGKATANRILSASLTDKILKEKGIEATLNLAKSPNSKIIVVGNTGNSMPIILGAD